MTEAGEEENLSFLDVNDELALKWERMSSWYRWKTSGIMSHWGESGVRMNCMLASYRKYM